HRPLHAPERVHVLGLGTDAPWLTRSIERGIDIAPQRALLHAYIAHAERAQDVAQLGDIASRYLRCGRSGVGHRLGDDLDQRDVGATGVDAEVKRTVHTTAH